ncbi:hypothetical protein NP777_10025 [Streptomyces sp. RCU064]|uniref:Uncharacterized protein n=1 Tax=Streptomyces rugosispiralis TaxID=2967341 RepID=A0ABT1UTY7_9ACTN|nr:hypothetical protein [Streptomyces rugosispiralis]MCQ8188582.1 hypothetical protein [Streptomyces rugosispiralis]
MSATTFSYWARFRSGSHLYALRAAVADLHPGGHLGEAAGERVVDVVVDVHPLGGDADLAGVHEAGPEELLGDRSAGNSISRRSSRGAALQVVKARRAASIALSS